MKNKVILKLLNISKKNIQTRRKKAQISIEYMIIFGTLLAFLIIIIHYFMQSVPTEIQLKQSGDAVNKIAKTVDTVYSMGPGAKRIIYLSMPKGVETINVTPFKNKIGGEIMFKISYKGKPMEIVAVTKANVTGGIPYSTGNKKNLYKLSIKTEEDGVVNITTI